MTNKEKVQVCRNSVACLVDDIVVLFFGSNIHILT